MWLTMFSDHFVQVDRFLKKQNPDFTGDKKPFLFYNSDWLVETEDFFDQNGKAILDNTGATANLRTFIPPNANTLDDATRELLDDMKEGAAPNCS